jgi:hypothetical protein
MAFIRLILAILSVALGGFVLYEGLSAPHLDIVWPLYVVPAACALNIFYLLASVPRGHPTRIPSRLIRLIDLWLVAKEEELKRRAKQQE